MEKSHLANHYLQKNDGVEAQKYSLISKKDLSSSQAKTSTNASKRRETVIGFSEVKPKRKRTKRG